MFENGDVNDDVDADARSSVNRNDPGRNYCAAFTFKQTVQLAEHMFATAQIFFLALTNMLRVLGCRPSSLHTMKFVKTLQSSFDLHEKHLWRVRTEYSKNKNIPQNFAVAMDMYNPVLCPLLSTAIALTHVKPSLVLDDDDDTLFGVLYASTREHTRTDRSTTLPSDRTLREQFKEKIVRDALNDTSTSIDYLGLYSYRKFMVTHLVNAFHCNELHAKARAGWVEFERQATAQATGSTTAASWVSSVDVSSHYIALESAGDERMALILSGRHPDAPYKNYMLQWLARNCPNEVVEDIVADIFPANVRRCFLLSGDLQRALVYALLIGKAKISAKLREAFGRRCGLFERDCFQTPVVEALVRHLRGIPLYPFAEPNTTYLSYVQQGRMAHYEVNEATSALECIEFVQKPVRVLCEGFVGVSTTKSTTTTSKVKTEPVDAEDERDLVAKVIDLALDSDSDAEDATAAIGAVTQDNDDDETRVEEESGTADDKENVFDADASACIETTFAARLGYDRATHTVTLSEATDLFIADLLVALQRHYNTRGRLADLLRTIFKQWTQPLSAIDKYYIPALELWPEPAMHALKRAALSSKNKIASRLHYAYISRRDVVKLCVRHFVTMDKAIVVFEDAKLKSLKEVKEFCKTI